MFYESLFNPSIHRPVKACLTGAGEFGASFLFQAQGMPLLEVPAVCTRTVQRAVDAYENAGIPASKVRVCESAEDAKKAYADGFNVVVDSFEYIADLPLDVLVESSGAPEASAAAAELAIERGMHVVMVSKETDSVVGSILARKAAERGLVYTTGGGNLRPLCDLCGRAVRDLPKGTVLDMGGHHHTIDGVEGVLNPAAAIGPDAALPFYLLSHRTLCRDVPAGKLITLGDLDMPEESTLLRLRREQDRAFGLVK